MPIKIMPYQHCHSSGKDFSSAHINGVPFLKCIRIRTVRSRSVLQRQTNLNHNKVAMCFGRCIVTNLGRAFSLSLPSSVHDNITPQGLEI